MVLTHIPMGALPPGWVNLYGHVHNTNPFGRHRTSTCASSTPTTDPSHWGAWSRSRSTCCWATYPKAQPQMTGSATPRAPTDKRSVAEASSCGSTERATGSPPRRSTGPVRAPPGNGPPGLHRARPYAEVRGKRALSGRSVPALPPPCTIRGVRSDGGPRHGEHAGTRRRLTGAERDNEIEQQQDHPGRDRGHRRTGGARGRHSDAGPSAGAGRDLERLGRRPEARCSPYDSGDYGYSQSVEDRIIRSLGGVYGPYTGRWFGSKRETDIEHIVARSEAHDSGLCRADRAARRRFSEDLRNLTLAAPSREPQSETGPRRRRLATADEPLLVRGTRHQRETGLRPDHQRGASATPWPGLSRDCDRHKTST